VDRLKLLEGVPAFSYGSRHEVTGMSLGASLDLHSGGSCSGLALLEVVFVDVASLGLVSELAALSTLIREA